MINTFSKLLPFLCFYILSCGNIENKSQFTKTNSLSLPKPAVAEKPPLTLEEWTVDGLPWNLDSIKGFDLLPPELQQFLIDYKNTQNRDWGVRSLSPALLPLTKKQEDSLILATLEEVPKYKINAMRLYLTDLNNDKESETFVVDNFHESPIWWSDKLESLDFIACNFCLYKRNEGFRMVVNEWRGAGPCIPEEFVGYDMDPKTLESEILYRVENYIGSNWKVGEQLKIEKRLIKSEAINVDGCLYENEKREEFGNECANWPKGTTIYTLGIRSTKGSEELSIWGNKKGRGVLIWVNYRLLQ